MIGRFVLIFTLSWISMASAQEVEKIVILGGGMAGLSSAIFAGQSGLSPLVVEGKNSGQTTAVYQIDNYPGFPEGISGDELIQRTKDQALLFGTRFKEGAVQKVDTSSRPFALHFDDGSLVYAESIIVSLGTQKRWMGLDAEKTLMGKGVSGSATYDAPKFSGKEVVVVGGGDSALDEALVLAKYASKVTIIHRQSTFTANEQFQKRVLTHPLIEVIWNSTVTDITDVNKGFVDGVKVKNLHDGSIANLPCEGVFVSIGRIPNTGMFDSSLEITQEGLLKVEAPGTHTSVPGVFAAGDISDPTYRKAITAAASGCMAAIDALNYLDKKEP